MRKRTFRKQSTALNELLTLKQSELISSVSVDETEILHSILRSLKLYNFCPHFELVGQMHRLMLRALKLGHGGDGA